jgi:hypothetical protein
MSKPIEVGCLVMVVQGYYPEFVGKVGTVLARLEPGEKYKLNNDFNFVGRLETCWVVDFISPVHATVLTDSRGLVQKDLSQMVFLSSYLVRINGDDPSLDESECDSISKVDTISRVKGAV